MPEQDYEGPSARLARLKAPQELFDVDRWRNDPHLPEGYPLVWDIAREFSPTPTKLDSSVVGPKQEALVWYAQNLKKLPGRAWQVLICLWNASPTDFTLFTISHEEISKTTGIAICFIPNAVKDLEENGLILVVRKRRSKKLHPRNRYALVPPTKLDSSVVRQSSIRAEASDSRA